MSHGVSAPGESLRRAAERTAALLARVPDGRATVPGMEWSAADTAAHLVATIRKYHGFVDGTIDAQDMLARAAAAQNPGQRSAVSNAAYLADFADRDVRSLAETMVPAVEKFLAATPGRRDDEPILADTGFAMTVATMTAVLLGEQLIHGLDIARAAGSAWLISNEDALQVIAGVMAMVPDYVDRQRAAGRHITYELRFRGGQSYRLLVDDGTATITAPGGPVDCWISSDPAAFLLVGYGRVSQWGQILRGRIVAGGRKPWLGAAFGQLLTPP
jgi:uncharacterized protein (TIGR03083 family)